LQVIESGVHEICKAPFIQRQPGRDQTYVKPGSSRGADKFDEIGTRERLAAGEINLQHSCFGSFSQHSRPDFGRQL
jgi:hypothetical protein